MKKLQLVEGWQNAGKWLSVKCMAAAGAVQSVWLTVPDDMKATMPAGWVGKITIALLVLGIVGRLLQQNPVEQVPK